MADYIKHLLTILEDEPARMLEELMRTQTRPYHSEYSDRLRAEGIEQGIEQGKLEEARQVLVELLEATQSGITPEQRQRVEASTDREQLLAWRRKFIASGGSAEGLFVQ